MTICFWTSYIPEKKPSKHKGGWGRVGVKIRNFQEEIASEISRGVGFKNNLEFPRGDQTIKNHVEFPGVLFLGLSRVFFCFVLFFGIPSLAS